MRDSTHYKKESNMKKFWIIAFLALFFVACDTGTNTPTPPPVVIDTSTVDNPVAQTCLESKTGLPAGTYAFRRLTKEKQYLDSNGCFSFPQRGSSLVAARIVAGEDSVIFYNDSALFSLSIPYVSQGDTLEVVPTVISLKNCPNLKVDTVYLAVFDKENILSRKVRMKRANFGDSSEYGRTLWSVDNGNTFQVHFEIHSNASTWASRVIQSEPGGTISLNYDQIQASSVPTLKNISDSIFFYSGDIVNISGDSLPKNTYSDTTLKIQAYSIYGIASVTVDGIVSDSIPYFAPDSMVYVGETANQFNLISNAKPARTVTVIVTDSAGYIETKLLKVWSGNTIMVDGKSDTPRQVNYNRDNKILYLYH